MHWVARHRSLARPHLRGNQPRYTKQQLTNKSILRAREKKANRKTHASRKKFAQAMRAWGRMPPINPVVYARNAWLALDCIPRPNPPLD